MSFKTPIICDRRVFDKKGKWESHQSRTKENVFYFIKEPLTLISEYINGREVVRETLTITAFGGKPIIQGDYIYLDNGTQYRVSSIAINEAEVNPLIKDMLKPRIDSMDLVLE